MRKLPRAALPEAFQRRLRVQGITVNDLEEFRGEILAAFENMTTGKEYSWSIVMAEKAQKAEVLSKKAFPGIADADVKASRADPCATVNVLVQVKHHHGFTNEHGLTQLDEIKKHELPEYPDHELVFCTSASTSKTFLKRAEELEITVIDGARLADWIAQHMERLSLETKRRRGICEVPTVFGSA